ncbi:Trp biosynthesis-associated membrane protein [Nocardioides sp.]|uniref:Trp biosynthesis-associated membrane protein n=1 Tax=Nocardioides sp. TaxID=35761 RepID=UPI003512504B
MAEAPTTGPGSGPGEPSSGPAVAEHRGRGLFGPTVLLGLAASGGAAVGGHRPMLAVPAETVTAAGGLATALADRSAEFPLAGALALVSLACWGALLVTRGVVRRLVAGLAALACSGILLVLVVGGLVQDDSAAADLATQLALNPAAISVERTGWYWVTLVSAVPALLAAVVAVRLLPSWPEMGTRYDSPTGAPASPGARTPVGEDDGERSNLDLWKSLDEGRDPTAEEPPASS